jgi:hypothetical protein
VFIYLACGRKDWAASFTRRQLSVLMPRVAARLRAAAAQTACKAPPAFARSPDGQATTRHDNHDKLASIRNSNPRTVRPHDVLVPERPNMTS